MKRFAIPIILMMVFAACSTSRDYVCDEIRGSGSIEKSHIITSSDSNATIVGRVFDEYGEGLLGATVLLIGHETLGTIVDIDGNFELKNIPPGTYEMSVKKIGFVPAIRERLEIKAGDQIIFEDLELIQSDLELKPIIYFYPEDTIALEVQLDYDGELLHTYPASDGMWELVAYPDGTLIDTNGRTYYSIFWEGQTLNNKSVQSGFVVKKAETIAFLEQKLALLGLNEREANEFIIFWLPLLNQNEQNFIHFDVEHYIEYARLRIDPMPETTIRIMMLYCAIDQNFDIAEQTLYSIGERKGFTVVEWGGKKIIPSHIALP